MQPNAGQRSTFQLTDLPPRTRKSMRPTILIVDDDTSFLELAATILASEGFDVRVARTPGEAVMWAVREPPDLILLDIVLRSADGLDVLEALREEPETAGIPVLACTGIGESASLLNQCGFNGTVEKPFDMRAFAQALKLALPERTSE